MHATSALNLATANSIVEPKGLCLQWLCSEHLSDVVALEQMVSPSPWRKQQFIDSMQATLVLTENGVVIGFAVVLLDKYRH